ncbi:Serine/threonine-protein kinase PknL [Planctomycetes bacterium Poly30]|uniref:non-specific serine/threonine protein kinase n=1 Tax=Saltatorellus ferox TaxID=2528018 RepID=A0A518EQ06_9BACT|nr:Serine/threonine-protein kinase PknL [Planctomycetes bacterium Poly30]
MTTTRLSLFDLAPDKVLLDRYRIHSGHRENGMSAAFRVHDLKHKEAERELQAFPASLFENVKQAEAFASTLRGWSKLDSSAILSLHDVVVLDDGAVLSISDFPPGEGLRDLMAERKTMPEDEVVALGIALLDGLEVAHDAGLIHGDIKPGTIFMGAKGGAGPVLVDGGVTPGLWAAKHLGTRTALIGTPYYAPLEQFGGDSPDERSDMYNLATVMYQLITGVMPWRGKSYIEVFQSKMQPAAPSMRSVAPSIEVNSDLEAAIATALRGKRMERHESAAAFREALSEIDFE